MSGAWKNGEMKALTFAKFYSLFFAPIQPYRLTGRKTSCFLLVHSFLSARCEYVWAQNCSYATE